MKSIYNMKLVINGEKEVIDEFTENIESYIFKKFKGQEAYDKKISTDQISYTRNDYNNIKFIWLEDEKSDLEKENTELLK